MHGWRQVSAEEPCKVCGRDHWCSTNGPATRCTQQATHPTWGEGIEKHDRNGNQFWLHIDPASRSEERRDTLTEATHHPQGNEKRANPETLNKVYAALIACLELSTQHERELRRRGISGDKIEHFRKAGYRSLPIRGRASIVTQLISQGLEEHFPRVPGFTCKTTDDDRRFWSLKGSAGLLIPIRNADGQIVAFTIRPDDPQRGQKYLALTSKANGQGVSPGSQIHVPQFSGNREVCRLTEGHLKAEIATVLSGMLTIGLPGVGSWKRAAEIFNKLGAKTIRMAFDADARTNPDVCRALEDATAALQMAGFKVELEVWSNADGKGIDDLLASGKEPEVISGQEVMSTLSQIAEEAQTESIQGRVQVLITADEHEVIEQAVSGLAQDDGVFSHQGQLVCVIHDDDNRPRIHPIKQAKLRTLLAANCYFFSEVTTEQGTIIKHAHPPDFVVKGVDALGYWTGIRPLDGLSEVPVLRSDGTILIKPGYDPATRLIYEPVGEIPGIPDEPSRDDALEAMAYLKDIVTDFPFRTDAHRSSWLSGVLTPLAREAFEGCAPLHLMDANMAGSGKSMLTDIPAIITSGQNEMPRFSNTSNDDEVRKRITAKARAGKRLVLIDNIGGSFGGPSLDAALTSTVWSDRILTTSDMVELPLRMTWYGTGNNVLLKDDTARRVIHCRLESKVENPEDRDGFKYPDLLGHVRSHRMKYLRAALVVLRAYFVAGRPPQELKAWGSFQGWSDIVRNALVWLGEPDPGMTRTELRQKSDRDAAALAALVEGWKSFDDSNDGLTAAQIVKKLDEHPDDFEAVRESLLTLTRKDKLTPRNIGYPFRKFKGRIIRGHAIDSGTAHGGVQAWKVVPVGGDEAPEKASPPVSPPGVQHVSPHSECDLKNSGGDGDDGGDTFLPTREEPQKDIYLYAQDAGARGHHHANHHHQDHQSHQLIEQLFEEDF